MTFPFPYVPDMSLMLSGSQVSRCSPWGSGLNLAILEPNHAMGFAPDSFIKLVCFG